MKDMTAIACTRTYLKMKIEVVGEGINGACTCVRHSSSYISLFVIDLVYIIVTNFMYMDFNLVYRGAEPEFHVKGTKRSCKTLTI